jgi:hypothetical protein
MKESDFQRFLTAKLLKDVRSLEDLLGLPPDFFFKLLEEGDDWSFIIKTHALIESGTTRLLEAVVAPGVPSEFLQSLPLDGRNSKLRLLEMLEHLDADHVKFIKGLSRVRNLLVHDVTQVAFVLKDYLASLSTSDVHTVLSEICCMFYDSKESKPKREKQRSAILPKARFHIWRTALFFLALTSLKLDIAKLKLETQQIKRKTLMVEAERARLIMGNLARPMGRASQLYRHYVDRFLQSSSDKPASN